ncbi:TlpA family protein disulfide reductase [Mucilaginibacter mali]|uniref:TlpA family protein disulfide reductase n=1 Tax=Mucilaginibacter mali TaxID=2740462 RepID=A0A7D4TYF3_9SPHI|nr:TlpA disulfide reductase family protein [Mucilaginibacter mali]QKJ31337.1 TlpA family protein disulfide reductase [Mucilaginibacter mali]
MTKFLKTSNLLNGLFFLAVLVLLFNPSAKAVMIRGLMKVGLFQPDMDMSVEKSAAVPDVIFQSTDGRKIHLSDLKGKVVFINFWATWCPPCIAEMPSINSLYQKLKNNKNIVFIIVDADRNFSKSVSFMQKNRFTMPLYQLASNVPPELVSNAIPATTILDKTGRIVFHQNGSADYSNPKILEYLNRIAK